MLLTLLVQICLAFSADYCLQECRATGFMLPGRVAPASLFLPLLAPLLPLRGCVQRLSHR